MRKYLPTFLILAASGFASPGVQAQPLRVVAVIDAVKFPPKAKLAHDRLRESLQETLSPKSWFLAEQRRIADCGGTIECMAKVAGDTNTDYVVRLSGRRTRNAGELTVELFTAKAGRIESTSVACDHCDLQGVNQATGKAVLDLLASALEDEATRKEEAKQAAAPPPPPPDPSPSEAAPAIVTPPPVAEPAPVRWLPWALIGTGAIAVGYGAWALAKNGDATGSCSDSPTATTCAHYSSSALGAGLLIGGGALLVTGTFWLLATPSHTAAVVASPNRVALHVRF